jgi:hypothetical protein
MKTIQQMIDALVANKNTIEKNQAAYMATLSIKEQNRISRNGRANGGWVVPGISAWTKAVKAAKLPWNHFWSGSNPTPSTQYPKAIYDFLTKLNS